MRALRGGAIVSGVQLNSGTGSGGALEAFLNPSRATPQLGLTS